MILMSAKVNPQWVVFMLIKLFTRDADCPQRTWASIKKHSTTLTPLNHRDQLITTCWNLNRTQEGATTLQMGSWQLMQRSETICENASFFSYLIEKDSSNYIIFSLEWKVNIDFLVFSMHPYCFNDSSSHADTDWWSCSTAWFENDPKTVLCFNGSKKILLYKHNQFHKYVYLISDRFYHFVIFYF